MSDNKKKKKTIIRQSKCEHEMETELKDIRQTIEINMAPCKVAKRL